MLHKPGRRGAESVRDKVDQDAHPVRQVPRAGQKRVHAELRGGAIHYGSIKGITKPVSLEVTNFVNSATN
jgi:hypothetical protein